MNDDQTIFWALGDGKGQCLSLILCHVEAVNQHDGLESCVRRQSALRGPGGKPALCEPQPILVGAVLLLKSTAGGENGQ